MKKHLSGISRRTVVGGLVAGAGATMFTSKSATAQAAEWPNRPVTFTVPFGPGASNDTFTRQLCQILSRKFNQPFVVENRAGTNGFNGAYSVATAPPDGYRFLESPQSIASFKPVMRVELDPVTQLESIACLARSPYAVLTNATLPVTNIKELIDYAKKNPDTTFYAASGPGSAGHLYTELFNKITGTKIKKVDYKSSADGQTDLVAGRVQMMFVTVAATLGHIKSGQLRLLAYTNDSAPKDAPAAPLLAAEGVPGMAEIQSWWGILAPKKLNPGIIEKVNKAINEALVEPEFVALFSRSSAIPAPMSPADFHKLLIEEVVLTEKIIKDAGIKIE
jgi:tripartite-type tricarboxylate transporter receptor subunit TctC